jgi:hypothetical protein
MNRILLGFSLASIVAFLAISFVRWQFHDDLSFQMQLEQQGLLKFTVDKYLNWDARFLTPFGFIWFALYKYIGFPGILVLVSFSFFICSWLIVRIVCREFTIKINGQLHLIAASVLNILIWYSLRNISSFTLYWTTASVYIINVMLALFWADVYLKKIRGNGKYTLSFLIFSFFVASSCQNITLGLLGMIGIDLMITFFKKDLILHVTKGEQIKLFVVFIIGVIAATVSPGSMVQLNKMQEGNYDAEATKHGIKHYIDHFIHLYLDAFKSNSIWLIGSAFLFVVVIIIINNKKIEWNKMNGLKALFSPWRLLFNNKWYFAAFFSLMIYWPTLLYSDRYYIGFYFFLFIALCFTLLRMVRIREDNFNFSAIKLALVLILSGGIFLFCASFKESLLVHKFMVKRHEFLEQNRGTNSVSIDAIDFGKGGFSPVCRSSEIRKDFKYHENRILSGFYNIDTVKPAKYLSKNDLENLFGK